MPINKYFAGHGDQVMSNMVSEYDKDKGKRVFYATANKRKQTADDMAKNKGQIRAINDSVKGGQ